MPHLLASRSIYCLGILGSELLLAHSFFVQVSHGPTDGKILAWPSRAS
jgi:hypothetical protein